MTTSMLEVGDLFSSLGAHGIERQLQYVVGVGHVSVNPVSGSTTVVYDPGKTSLSALQEAIEDCSFHCAGEALPMFAMTTRCRAGLARGPDQPDQARALPDAYG
jgi:Cu2+-exporting ATPase